MDYRATPPTRVEPLEKVISPASWESSISVVAPSNSAFILDVISGQHDRLSNLQRAGKVFKITEDFLSYPEKEQQDDLSATADYFKKFDAAPLFRGDPSGQMQAKGREEQELVGKRVRRYVPSELIHRPVKLWKAPESVGMILCLQCGA
jgi:hypothetical protein